MILQGDYVRIKKKSKFKDRIGRIVGFNPQYKEYYVKLLSTDEVINCTLFEMIKIVI